MSERLPQDKPATNTGLRSVEIKSGMATETMGAAQVTLHWLDIGGPRLAGFQKYSLTPSSIFLRIEKFPYSGSWPDG